MGLARILFVADTHLGFDLPFRPRVERRRRGPDFFDNFNRAMDYAIEEEYHCVVHGGDLLYRSKVPGKLVDMAFEPLKRVADHGVPVYLVPGNHERSVIPPRLFNIHPGIQIFRKPTTFTLDINGFRLALSGFPYIRKQVRKHFLGILKQTGWRKIKADARLLCVHHCIEGAAVGPSNYMFRYNDDVVRMSEIPDQFVAVLSGHIHRFQVLTKDLKGNPISTPVFYPGSVERTSFAEKDEDKGFLTLNIGKNDQNRAFVKRWHFHKMPARPMQRLDINIGGLNGKALKKWIATSVAKLPQDSIVMFKIRGPVKADALKVLRAASMRTMVPKTMNFDVSFVGGAADVRRDIR